MDNSLEELRTVVRVVYEVQRRLRKEPADGKLCLEDLCGEAIKKFGTEDKISAFHLSVALATAVADGMNG